MAAKRVLNQAVVKEVKKYGAILREKHISYERLIVFGSQAKGKAKKWSDIDICVVSKAFGKDYHTEMVNLMLASDDSDYVIEPHPYNPIDLQEKYDSLASEIRKYGIPVV